MRRLATELGVGAMTLYGYFATKDELLDAAADLAAQEISIPPRRGGWKAQLRALMTEIHAVLQRHPSGVQMRATAPILSAGALRSTNAGVGVMLEAGFSKREAARAWRLLFAYTFGSAVFTPAEVPDQQRREWHAQLAALPADELPWVVSLAPEAAEALGGPQQFRHGLDLILDGLETRLRK